MNDLLQITAAICISDKVKNALMKANISNIASWKYPFLALSEPVNAPLTSQKKADGASSYESEPQYTATNG